MKRILLAFGALLIFGVFKNPAEQHLLVVQQGAGFQLARLGEDIRVQLGQMGFVAALSGFRALMADLLWIRAGTAFEATDWTRLEMFLHSATRLQPRAIVFWEMAHFHMAYDAATAMREDTQRQPSEALRRRAERQYIEIGERFLQQGIEFNPENARLYEHLGNLYRNRLRDHARAARCYAASAEKPGAMQYVRRFAAFEWAKVPGMEQEAYNRLRDLYLESPMNHVPTLLHYLGELEEKLAVPAQERVYSKPSPPDAVRQKPDGEKAAEVP
jgi:hypothetical protein